MSKKKDAGKKVWKDIRKGIKNINKNVLININTDFSEVWN